MKIHIDKSFAKDLRKIDDEKIKNSVADIIESINLSKIYMPICDYWMIFDNSDYPSKLIADGFNEQETKVYDDLIYNKIVKP